MAFSEVTAPRDPPQALSGIPGVSLANLYFDPTYAKEDCRSLATTLAAETTGDDLVIVNAGYMASAVSYYYPGPARVVGYPSDKARQAPASTALFPL